MIKNRDIEGYAVQQQWHNKFYKPISEISKPNKNKKPLVDMSDEIYCFDDISNSVKHKDHTPTSADGMFFSGNNVYFVEFKTGFKKKITLENYDDDLTKCTQFDCPCEEHKKWFFKNQEMETEELKAAIKFKAIESYITLEKQILPLCDEVNNVQNLILIVVIDGDGNDEEENTLLELSEKGEASEVDENNCFRALEKSLKRLKSIPNNSKFDYYYDDIKVLSAKGFKKFIKAHQPNMPKTLALSAK